MIRKICHDYNILLITDEVMTGFGRTGKMFTYEHYGIKPDLIACGKGISSSLPIVSLACILTNRTINYYFNNY